MTFDIIDDGNLGTSPFVREALSIFKIKLIAPHLVWIRNLHEDTIISLFNRPMMKEYRSCDHVCIIGYLHGEYRPELDANYLIWIIEDNNYSFLNKFKRLKNLKVFL
jgi:hypothetical protein